MPNRDTLVLSAARSAVAEPAACRQLFARCGDSAGAGAVHVVDRRGGAQEVGFSVFGGMACGYVNELAHN